MLGHRASKILGHDRQLALPAFQDFRRSQLNFVCTLGADDESVSGVLDEYAGEQPIGRRVENPRSVLVSDPGAWVQDLVQHPRLAVLGPDRCEARSHEFFARRQRVAFDTIRAGGIVIHFAAPVRTPDRFHDLPHAHNGLVVATLGRGQDRRRAIPNFGVTGRIHDAGGLSAHLGRQFQ